MKEELIRYWARTKLITNPDVLKAFSQVERSNFIGNNLSAYAYDDTPLPIENQQTISQPTTVLMMLQALELQQNDVVLEIGAGSGYNAAIMSKLVQWVYTTEIIPELVDVAKANLSKEGIKNVEVIGGDGSLGYPSKAPYEKIIATAACPEIPNTLVEQLKEGGRLIAPVGDLYQQRMIIGNKHRGTLERSSLGQFMFVPLKGKYGF